MNELVSVIVPVYRAAGTLQRCVDSLALGQYSNLEIILIEDGSPDNSWEVCLQLQEKYPCVKAYRNETNCGVSVTRNHGLRQVTGDFLMFVDSDDWVEPDYVSSFMEVWHRHHPALIVCGYMNHDEHVNARTDFIGWDSQEALTFKSLREEMLPMYHRRLLSSLCNKLLYVPIIRQQGLTFDTAIQMGEDLRFLTAYLRYVPGDTVAQINRGLYHYDRCGETSLMSRFGRESMEEPLKDLERLYILLGMDEQERAARLAADRQAIIRLRAYIVYHNVDMSRKEKKQLILEMDPENGSRLYRDNRILYLKEQTMALLRRLGLHR